MNKAQDPIELVNLLEEVSEDPIRPECVEGWVIVPPQPDYNHGKSAYKLSVQLTAAGLELAGMGMGFRVSAHVDQRETTWALVIPDFYVLHREPTDLDEAYRKAHKGWYPIDLVALAGEVTSTNHETDTGPKYRSYAAAGVPVYVVVNRQERQVQVHSEPVADPDDPTKSHYRTTLSTELGGKVELPAPYPVLDTALMAND
ncbi:hypothetical protein GCM10010324_25470 [Streptomyces hiroshimensis]|uniref:Putative restriction endonuclease domain-containing protein n=2 Tax=Streptomyces hiroshimensis TaxID=66424 RepID=A0ABQ2YCI8_9ACTN|nr:hypothetical protein GCM10010324_25470 [Streptomyces hiroshimensis]